jgi:hypothetical protein
MVTESAPITAEPTVRHMIEVEIPYDDPKPKPQVMIIVQLIRGIRLISKRSKVKSKAQVVRTTNVNYSPIDIYRKLLGEIRRARDDKAGNHHQRGTGAVS